MKQLLPTLGVEVDYNPKQVFIDNGFIKCRLTFLRQLYHEYEMSFTRETMDEIENFEENNICSFLDYIEECGNSQDEEHIHTSYYKRDLEFEHVFERGVNETIYLIETLNLGELEKKLNEEGIGIDTPLNSLSVHTQYLVGGFYGLQKTYNNSKVILYWIKNQAEAILGEDLLSETSKAYRYINKVNKNKFGVYFEA